MTKKESPETVDIPAVEQKSVTFRLIGDSRLVVHQFSDTSKKAIRDKEAGKAKPKRGVRNPGKEFEEARYRLPDGRDGVKARAVKKAMISACSFVSGVTKVQMRGAFFVNRGEDLIPIEHARTRRPLKPKMREDMVRVGGKGPGTGKADIRYRPDYGTSWALTVTITYDPTIVTMDQVVNLANRAGFSIGLCEERPEKDGEWGMFHVETGGGRQRGRKRAGQ